jgi:hypothetical protein
MRFIGYNAAREMVTEASPEKAGRSGALVLPDLPYGESRFADSV